MAEPRRGGTYIGRVPLDHPYADPHAPVTMAVDPSASKLTPYEYMKQQAPDDSEGFMMPGSNLLFILEHKDKGVPMSYLDPESENG